MVLYNLIFKGIYLRTVQLNLMHMCTHVFYTSKILNPCANKKIHTTFYTLKYKMWCVSSYLHMDLSSTLVRINTHDTLDMQHMNKLSWAHIKRTWHTTWVIKSTRFTINCNHNLKPLAL